MIADHLGTIAAGSFQKATASGAPKRTVDTRTDAPPPRSDVLAIAYTDVDPGDGDGFKDGTDVLIAKLVDTNGDGVVSAGDTVVTNRYPKNFAATTFGNFGETSHLVDGIIGSDSNEVSVQDGALKFIWADIADGEVYSEYDQTNAGGTYTQIVDAFSATGRLGEGITVNEMSPSVPDSSFAEAREQPSDDPHIDVDILIP
jgi:hypothetical protein